MLRSAALRQVSRSDFCCFSQMQPDQWINQLSGQKLNTLNKRTEKTRNATSRNQSSLFHCYVIKALLVVFLIMSYNKLEPSRVQRSCMSDPGCVNVCVGPSASFILRTCQQLKFCVLNEDCSCGTVVLADCVPYFSLCLFLYRLLKIHGSPPGTSS